MTPAERIEDAYLDAISTLMEVLGVHEDDDWIGINKEPGVDLDTIPAAAINAGRAAMKYLAVGAGILDGQGETESAMDADAVLAMWAGEGER